MHVRPLPEPPEEELELLEELELVDEVELELEEELELDEEELELNEFDT